ncbi:hydantoinase/oxoprolinase family protein [Thiohalophilus sp.]|uniref:hydantoinase/oxoprolinase family protein n=1 Tax=Thiohalophilus sp. TaxID=3028392 RepID=UPI002ACDCE66|nr:hydantoinase/oxoprolinase family protein [Thiohalophilus sp.]MDZ7803206.1 hydantoinase/oxoprolinase family protein [Thiohalophilus sp.]
MIIGIDVGGTHADGVLLQGNAIVAKKKVAVDHDNLGESIIALLESLLPSGSAQLSRIHLSTTLCTNALISGNLDRVGMLVQAGPGMNPDFFKVGDDLYFLSGAVDHRGKVLRGPTTVEVSSAIENLRRDGVDSVGVVTKFSHRNNEHELWVGDQLRRHFRYISMGHRLSGMPNFPRRVYTTWLNSALKTGFSRFRKAMEDGFARLGINCPCYILKADGGTIPFDRGCEFPCQAVHSGPSASVMGALAIVGGESDAILLDIGGTTTDIALLAQGVPLLEPYGATVAGRPTLIRALLTQSIGLGGDSVVARENGDFQIGPGRVGPPMGFGGSMPTPTDAMIVLGTITEGSAEKAGEGMRRLIPDQPEKKTAAELLECFAGRVHEAVERMIEEAFSRPVYTVTDFLQREKIRPERLITIGGPAQALQNVLENRFGLDCVVPPDYEVANAVGSARARITVQASLYGDTAMGTMTIPEISLMESIGKRFDMAEAEARLEEAVCSMAAEMGEQHPPQVDFIERLEVNTVRGFATAGKIFSLKAQIRPGLTKE